jgi:hypothetical protein
MVKDTYDWGEERIPGEGDISWKVSNEAAKMCKLYQNTSIPGTQREVEMDPIEVYIGGASNNPLIALLMDRGL